MNAYVLSNSEGVVLAVYGEALLNEANAKAESIASETKCSTHLHTIKIASYRDRPHVGGTISMKGSYLTCHPKR
jgi:hypothetical protein